jgi:hypothetical protein
MVPRGVDKWRGAWYAGITLAERKIHMPDTKTLLKKYGLAKPRSGWSPPRGWYNLLDSLINSLIEAGWDKNLLQCKEKFGGLRFYVGPTTPEIHTIIAKYEQRSYDICSWCGTECRRQVGFNVICQECEINCNDVLLAEEACIITQLEVNRLVKSKHLPSTHYQNPYI